MVVKIPSGIYGLNALMDGGINESSATVVIGSSGAGKTILATQFLRKGLELGQEGIYITLDEPPKQIVNEAMEMGWPDIKRYLEDDLLAFIDASGKQFSDFVRTELAEFVKEWKGSKARIVVDPLTPVMWSSKEKYEQRDLISFLFRETKTIGTVLCTLEEHGLAGDLSHPDTIIPMYLSDSVIHLKYVIHDDQTLRMIKIIKCRQSRHSHKSHQYFIVKGPGLVVKPIDFDRQKMPDVTKRLNQLPENARENIREMMKSLSKQNLEGIELPEVLQIIVQDYEYDLMRNGTGQKGEDEE
jgi:KaiC/GvpD/RAD55 family RecA-like ATPase